jgi:hypothetical protein
MNDTHDENTQFQTNTGMMSIKEFRAQIAADGDESDFMFVWDEACDDWFIIDVEVEPKK